VHNTFVKVLDHARDGNEGPYKRTIAYREFAFFHGEMQIALGVNGLEADAERQISDLFWHVQSLGKRGGFWQCLNVAVQEEPLSAGFTEQRTRLPADAVSLYGTTHALDDFGEPLCTAPDAFDRISTYGEGAIILGRHRALSLIAIPYRRVAASRRATFYRRTV
jgi:hypothetical protein